MRRGLLAVGLVAVLLLATAADVSSRSGGITGQAQGGCTCHSAGPSAIVVPSISGLPATWSVGTAYPITVSFTGGPGFVFNPDRINTGGFNLHVTGGNLSASSSGGAAQTPTADKSEATHTTLGNDQTSWALVWNSPVTGFGNGTIYAYLATNSVNGDGVNSLADEWNKILVTMTGPADTTAPSITGVTATPSVVSAIIRWTTDDASDTVVDYGTSASYGFTSTRNEAVTSHSLTLTGLAQSTTYHFRVRSTNLNALESVSGDLTFTTGSDVTPPVANINRPFTGRVYLNDVETNTFSTITPTAIGTTLTVNVFATDASGVGAVEIYVDTLATKRADAMQTGPTTWTWSWFIGGETLGTHALYAKAYDTGNNARTVTMMVNVVPLPATL
jgi:hypothetical protein